MNTYNQGIVFGIIFAVLFLVIIILLRKAQGKEGFDKFDERQIVARGKAFQFGFFALMIVICIDACLKMVDMAFYEDPLGEFAAIFIALIVFAAQSIRYDAFKGYNKNGRSLIIIYVVVTISQLFNTISEINSGSLVADGKLTLSCISPICLVTFASVLLMVLIKQRSDRLEMAGEE